jgi:thymidylate synthase (FAD)
MKAEITDTMGSDAMVVNVARVSYDRWIPEIEFSQGDERLIKYLVEHKHVSPFFHPKVQFYVECPIFVERQLTKHLIGLAITDQWEFNSISGRYVNFSEEFYEITELREQSKSSKQGSGEIMDRPDLLIKMGSLVNDAKWLYKELTNAGVAKEIARMILPMNLMTKFIWTGSLYSYIHLFDLRLKPDAQKETRMLVQSMFDQIVTTNLFKYSMKAFFPQLEEWGNDNNG